MVRWSSRDVVLMVFGVGVRGSMVNLRWLCGIGIFGGVEL